jgi:hypothetical protein
VAIAVLAISPTAASSPPAVPVKVENRLSLFKAFVDAVSIADDEGFVNFMDIDPENVIGCAWWKYG